jgi:hypothetical protein
MGFESETQERGPKLRQQRVELFSELADLA